MTNTTLIINEQEKENAKALTQSFARADVKSRAYINALGAEVCMQYLQDNDIVSDRVYNLHNIRKILEEFDISDIMLSNIHIDVRVVYDDNKIFVPKSHFDYNLTPDIYVVMQISGDYSQMEFLGFFEPKMINQNNTNGEYFFIEKEKLSSPVDLKNYIAEFAGNTSVGISEQDIENAEYLIISMADNNVSVEDKKQLIAYLNNSAELRDKFIEFENFEMLAYQTINSIEVNTQDNTNETDVNEMDEGGLDIDTIEDIELSNALNIDETVEEICEEYNENEKLTDDGLDENQTDDIFDIVEEPNINENNNSENIVGNVMKGAAVLGSEVAGAVLASAALSGTAECAEIAKDVAIATAATADGIDGIVEDSTDFIPDDLNNVTEHENIENFSNTDSPEIQQDEIQNSLDTLFNEENLAETNQTDIQDIGEIQEIEDVEDIPDIQDIKTEEDISNISCEMTDNIEEINVDNIFEEPTLDIQHEEINMNDSEKIEDTSFSEDIDINEFFDDIDEEIISNNDEDNILFEYDNELQDEFSNSIGETEINNNSKLSPFGKPIISPTGHTPISQATDLVSLESLQSWHNNSNEMNDNSLGNIATDNIKSQQINSEGICLNSDIEQLGLQEDNLTSDDFVQDMPEEIIKDTIPDETTSDDFVQDMPEEIIKDIIPDETTSDDFVQEMPQEIIKDIIPDETTSDDFVQEMPQEIIKDTMPDETTSDDFVQEMPQEIIKDTMPDETTSGNDCTIDAVETIENFEKNEGDEPLETNSLKNNVNKTFELDTDTDEQNNVDNILSDVNEMEDIKTNNTDNNDEETDTNLGLLYNNSGIKEINKNSINEELTEDYNYKPKRKIGLMSMFTILAFAVLAAFIVGFIVKNKNDVDETFVQSSTDNILNPESNNSDILASEELLEPAIPTDLENMSDSEPAPVVTKHNETNTNSTINKDAKQEIIKNAKAEIKKQQEQLVTPAPKSPLNASKSVTLKKLSWEIPDYLSYSDNIRKYLQSAGKSIKLTLSSDLLLTNEYIYSNRVKVDIHLNKNGDIKGEPKIVASSGSQQVDKIVLQTVKDTLNVVKPQRGEVPTPEYKLGLIIYL